MKIDDEVCFDYDVGVDNGSVRNQCRYVYIRKYYSKSINFKVFHVK